MSGMVAVLDDPFDSLLELRGVPVI